MLERNSNVTVVHKLSRLKCSRHLFLEDHIRDVDSRKAQPVARKLAFSLRRRRFIMESMKQSFLERSHSLCEPRVIQFWQPAEWKSPIDLTFTISSAIPRKVLDFSRWRKWWISLIVTHASNNLSLQNDDAIMVSYVVHVHLYFPKV